MFGLPDKWKERLKGMIKGAPVAPFVEVGDIYSFGKEMFKNYIYDREKKEVLPSGLISYNVQQKKAVPKHGELAKLATTNIGELTPEEQEKKIQQDLDLATSTMPIVGVGKVGSKMANKIASKKIGAVEKTGQKIGGAVSGVVKKTAKKFSDILDNVEATKPAEISKVEPTPTRVQPKVLTGKASTQKYDKLVEPKKGLDALRGEAKKYKSAEEFVKAQRTNKLYHVSDNPNLKLSKDYQPKQGQLGKGLYVTKDPEIWQGGQIGKRPYVYEIDASNLKIANDYPASSELIDWGSKNGYYKKDFLKKPNGEYVLGIDGKPMKIWQETSKAEKLMDYKDPMTGSKMSGLEQEYLKSKGYDGVSASYSPDGEQSLIFNYDKVKINPVKTKSQLTDIWNKANKNNADDALINEAKKYKSADEFIKKQSLYHGTPAKLEGNKLSFGKGGIKKGGQSGGLFLTDNQNSAKTFAFGGDVYQATPEIKKQVIDLTKKEGIDKFRDFIGKSYKDFDGELIKFDKQSFDLMFPNGKADFATVAQFPELVELVVKNNKLRGIAFNEYAGGEIGKTYQILSGDIPVYTKSQLTDIWNKAQSLSTNKRISLISDLRKETLEKKLKDLLNI